MRLSPRALGGAWFAVLVVVSLAAARTATVKDNARLRAGPSGTSELRVWLPAGTRVEVLGETAGWREVQAGAARGFIWGEHLVDDGGDGAAAAVEARPDPPPATGDGLTDDVRALRDEVRALRERPEPATAADLERLRADLERSGALSRRIADGGAPVALGDPASEGLLTLTPILLVIGGALGWAASRLVQRRRDRRQWNRLRL